MSTVHLPGQRPTPFPFSEVRATQRQATLAVIATSAVAASSLLITACLIAVGAHA